MLVSDLRTGSTCTITPVLSLFLPLFKDKIVLRQIISYGTQILLSIPVRCSFPLGAVYQATIHRVDKWILTKEFDNRIFHGFQF